MKSNSSLSTKMHQFVDIGGFLGNEPKTVCCGKAMVVRPLAPPLWGIAYKDKSKGFCGYALLTIGYGATGLRHCHLN